MIPKDPVMLLSYVNTQLRDNYSSLEELCKSLGIHEAQVKAALAQIDYHYDEAQRKFV